MKSDLERFTDEFFQELLEGNAALFAGAGLSKPAGFVDWKELVRPLAEELGLNAELETDFIAIAQFHVNAHQRNRHRLHQAIIDALSVDVEPTESHYILSQLPIFTWWTTNYDKLIEESLKRAGKIADVKIFVSQLALTRKNRDAIVYKMHGDVDRPDEAVATRDDYERYHLDRGAFVNALAGDLVSKTFLFLGFSFTDPNLDQVLSRVRITFQDNQRRHYAFFKKSVRRKEEDEESFRNGQVKQNLMIEDLKRFNIKSILIDDYDEIPRALNCILSRYRRRTVFLSSSASSFDPWGEHEVLRFMRQLGSALSSTGLRLSTGLGSGVGDALLSGALDKVLRDDTRKIEDGLILRPFPQLIEDAKEKQEIWERYRQDMIGAAGISLFLFGNKETPCGNVLADGMEREFQIAREHSSIVLPIGATGSMARKLADISLKNRERYLPELNDDQVAALIDLNEHRENLSELIEPIIRLINELKEAK